MRFHIETIRYGSTTWELLIADLPIRKLLSITDKRTGIVLFECA